ncbi:Aste57867_8291 [Aphanomyces stellatus]|uniref:Aste57867_8291 protein n=1 Tax=Aphanomyces stellatus TaxID=120398 RepID=A0A485KJX5_9STRA|nr:hypothetical protein As57867_008260 [Aphanomyces stellatus]VFT85178.1 Aste57867_8291 [Aphanomyces stellatus]
MTDDPAVPEVEAISCNELAWISVEGNPWWPVLVCDPTNLPPGLHSIGHLDMETVQAALTSTSESRLLYYFGRGTLALHTRTDVIRPWNCPEHHTLLQGHPMYTFRRQGVLCDFKNAMKEAQLHAEVRDNERRTAHSSHKSSLTYLDASVVSNNYHEEASQLPPGHIAFDVASATIVDGGSPKSSMGLGIPSSQSKYHLATPKVDVPQLDNSSSEEKAGTSIMDKISPGMQTDNPRLSLDCLEHNAPIAERESTDGNERNTFEKTMSTAQENIIFGDKIGNAVVGQTPASSATLEQASNTPEHANAKNDQHSPTGQVAYVAAVGSAIAGALKTLEPSDSNAQRVLADAELMAMAGDLGISLEIHTPTKQAGNFVISQHGMENSEMASIAEIQPQKFQSPWLINSPDPTAPFSEIPPLNSVAWMKKRAGPWWPVYICDPATIRSKLQNVKLSHYCNVALSRARTNSDFQLVYIFGLHTIGSYKFNNQRLKPWKCKEHSDFICCSSSEFNAKSPFSDFKVALLEAEDFLSKDESLRLFRSISPSCVDETTKTPKRSLSMELTTALVSRIAEEHSVDKENPSIKANENQNEDSSPHADMLPNESLAVELPLENVMWAKSNNGPFWPVYLCDPSKVRSNLHFLGNHHAPILYRARKNLQALRLVYFFGKHNFGLYKSNDHFKEWNCPEQQEYTQGENSGLRDESLFEEFSLAIMEAEEYLAADEIKRVLPRMTTTDMRDSNSSIVEISPASSLKYGKDTATDSPPREVIPPSPEGAIIHVPYDCVAWARSRNYPWWPVYVCDPQKLRSSLHILGDGHKNLLVQAKNDQTNLRLVFYFGLHKFGILKVNVRIRQINPWKCSEHELFLQGFPAGSLHGQSSIDCFVQAIQEATAYASSHESTRLLPRMILSDMNQHLEPPPQPLVAVQKNNGDEIDLGEVSQQISSVSNKKRRKIIAEIPVDTIAWSKSNSNPWWPVYVCDPFKLRAKLHHLGNRHRNLLVKAKQNSADHRLVYYFGRYVFGLIKLNGKVKPWGCVDQHDFVQGYPESSFNGQDDLDEFYTALKEAQDYLTADKESRLLPFFVASDMNPDIEPTILVCSATTVSSVSGGIEVSPVISTAHNADTSNANDTESSGQSNVSTGFEENAFASNTDIVQHSERDGSLVNHEITPKEATQCPIVEDEVFGIKPPEPCFSQSEVEKDLAVNETTSTLSDSRYDKDTHGESKKSFQEVNGAAKSETGIDSMSGVSIGSQEVQSIDEIHQIPHGSLAWARWSDGSWWPVYICDPFKIRYTLHNLGTRHHHNNNLAHAKKSSAHRLCYYFGRYYFGLQKKNLKPWNCPDHGLYLLGLGHFAVQKRDVFLTAIKEAQEYVDTDELLRLPPHMVSSDLDPTLEPPLLETSYEVPDERGVKGLDTSKHFSGLIPRESSTDVAFDSVGWAKYDGYPWWPIYVCDPTKVQSTLRALGNGHDYILNEALRKPDEYRILYFFGSHRFGLNENMAKTIQKWKGENHGLLLQGIPKTAMKKKDIPGSFSRAIDEANEFLASDQSILTFPDFFHEDTASNIPETEVVQENTSDQSAEPDVIKSIDIPFDCVAWAFLRGFPWLPVYVFNPFRLKSDLKHLGRGHASILEEARENPDTYRIVYYFGSHNFGLHTNPNETMKLWQCAEHNSFCFPTVDKKRRSNFRQQVKRALKEVSEFLATEERARLLPKMVATDMEPLSRADRLRPFSVATCTPPASKNIVQITKVTEKKTSKIKNEEPQQQSKSQSTQLMEPRSSSRMKRKSSPKALTFDNDSDTSINLPPQKKKGDRNDSLSKSTSKVKQLKNQSTSAIPYDSIAWGLLEGFPWLPVYVLDPFKLRSELHLLGKGHQGTLKKAKQYPDRYRIVYYFGSHNFGLHTRPESTLRLWNCAEHSEFVKGYPKTSCRGKKVLANLNDAVKEAECFALAEPSVRLLPYMVESDTNPNLAPPSPLFVPLNTLAWAISEGYPWMPVFVFDPCQLRPKLKRLGSGHRDLLRQARSNPDESRIVYYFGSHGFALHKLDGTLKPWNCPESTQYLEAKSDSLLYIKDNVMKDFDKAMHEVEVFNAMPESDRLLPEMEYDDFVTSGNTINSKIPTTRSPALIRHRERDLSDLPINFWQQDYERKSKRLRTPYNGPESSCTLHIDVGIALDKSLDEKELFSSGIAWVLWNDFIWWPVYICSPKQVRHHNYDENAIAEPNDASKLLIMVYHFGLKSFMHHSLDRLKPWKCDSHATYVQGEYASNGCEDVLLLLPDAIQEAEDFAECFVRTDDVQPPAPVDIIEHEYEVLGEPGMLTQLNGGESGDETLSDENDIDESTSENDEDESIDDITSDNDSAENIDIDYNMNAADDDQAHFLPIPNMHLVDTTPSDSPELPISSIWQVEVLQGKLYSPGEKEQSNTSMEDEHSLDADMIMTRDLVGPFFSVDVECVASGTGYAYVHDREVARIAIVGEDESTVFDSYVKPEKPVVSYLTELTGITAEHISTAQSLEHVIAELKKILPQESVLVGQSVDKDVQWLGLEAGKDFRQIFDVADLFRVPTTASYQYRYFSLRHVAKYLLEASIQESDHDPVVDAVYAMKVFKRYRYLHENSGHRQAVLQTLIKTPRTPSFAERHPVLDGVLMSPPKVDSSSVTDTEAPGMMAPATSSTDE